MLTENSSIASASDDVCVFSNCFDEAVVNVFSYENGNTEDVVKALVCYMLFCHKTRDNKMPTKSVLQNTNIVIVSSSKG